MVVLLARGQLDVTLKCSIKLYTKLNSYLFIYLLLTKILILVEIKSNCIFLANLHLKNGNSDNKKNFTIEV